MKTVIFAVLLSTALSFAQVKLTQTPENKSTEKTTEFEISKVKISDEFKTLLKSIGEDETLYLNSLKKREKARIAFQKLTKNEQQTFISHKEKAHKFAQEKRTVESLHHALEASSIYNQDNSLMNLLGANYIELRDFKTARKYFLQTYQMSPLSAGATFNLSEVYFVSKDYQNALKYLERAQKLSAVDTSISALTDIIQFKIELSHLALSNDTKLSQEARKKHREYFISANDVRDYKDHSLLTYYGKAAVAFSQNNSTEAKQWLKKARYIFNNKQAHLPWLDTLLEFGYVSEIYQDRQIETDLSEEFEKK